MKKTQLAKLVVFGIVTLVLAFHHVEAQAAQFRLFKIFGHSSARKVYRSNATPTANEVTEEVQKIAAVDETEGVEKIVPTEGQQPESQPMEVDGLTLTEDETMVYNLTNAERQRRGLPALRLSRKLVESARKQANWMARTGNFSHGKSGFAENIAMGQPSGFAVVRAWMNSTGHMRNIMNFGHGSIGIAAVRGNNGRLFWCQQFSR